MQQYRSASYFLPLRSLERLYRQSSGSIHMALCDEFHWYLRYMPDRFLCRPAMHGFHGQQQFLQWRSMGCCDRKYRHSLCILVDKKRFHRAQHDICDKVAAIIQYRIWYPDIFQQIPLLLSSCLLLSQSLPWHRSPVAQCKSCHLRILWIRFCFYNDRMHAGTTLRPSRHPKLFFSYLQWLLLQAQLHPSCHGVCRFPRNLFHSGQTFRQ